MALQTTGPISHSDIQAEFTLNAGDPFKLSTDGGALLQGIGDPKGPGDRIAESDFYGVTADTSIIGTLNTDTDPPTWYSQTSRAGGRGRDMGDNIWGLDGASSGNRTGANLTSYCFCTNKFLAGVNYRIDFRTDFWNLSEGTHMHIAFSTEKLETWNGTGGSLTGTTGGGQPPGYFVLGRTQSLMQEWYKTSDYTADGFKNDNGTIVPWSPGGSGHGRHGTNGGFNFTLPQDGYFGVVFTLDGPFPGSNSQGWHMAGFERITINPA